jgi:Bacterial aa3 type cytochrome c oxidase subunit IV
MAEHGQVEYATAEGNDLAEHEAGYERFVHLVFVGSAHVTNIVLGLAIGATTGHWLVSFAIFVFATLVALHGLMTGARLPSGVMVVISLIALALTAAGNSPAV